MKTFYVHVYREWTEYGVIRIEADNADEARELASESLSSDDDSIDWRSENMEPGQQDIETVEPAE